MTPQQEAKLDKLIEDVSDLKTNVAVIRSEAANYKLQIAKHQEEIEKLKQYKWTLTGAMMLLSFVLSYLFKHF